MSSGHSLAIANCQSNSAKQWVISGLAGGWGGSELATMEKMISRETDYRLNMEPASQMVLSSFYREIPHYSLMGQ